MSSFARHLISAAVAGTLAAGGAGAQLLGGGVLPAVNLPVPTGSLPVVGPMIQNVLADPAVRQQVIQPTLDTVGGLPQTVAESGASTLLELRRLRLQELIRSNRGVLESDGNGQPV
ncbi:MAG: hypothetical protein ACJ8FC_08625, partial [Sphingomicrobium sp.]